MIFKRGDRVKVQLASTTRWMEAVYSRGYHVADDSFHIVKFGGRQYLIDDGLVRHCGIKFEKGNPNGDFVMR